MSLNEKVSIMGCINLVWFTEIRWINHIEIEDIPIFIYRLFLNVGRNPISKPVISEIIIINLYVFDMKNICSGFNNQFIVVPDIILINLIRMIGLFENLVVWFEFINFFNKFLLENKDIRIEYEAVIPIDIIIIMDKIDSILLEIIFSIIASFEKNPDIKGIPISAMFVIPIIDKVSGVWLKLILIIRMSWYEDSWIIIPAHRNIVDLNKAWIIKWENARVIEFKEIANIIIAICLSVDKAMIFFRSCSQQADILE